MLGAMQTGAWETIIKLNDKMIDAGIRPNSTSFQGVILACNRLGGREPALKAVKNALKADTPMNSDAFKLCSKVLLPEIFVDGNLDETRAQLRQMIKQQPSFTEDIMELNRSLRRAQLEDRRQPSKMKGSIHINQEREHLWRQVLKNVVRLSQSMHFGN